jgi:hypothetical protein
MVSSGPVLCYSYSQFGKMLLIGYLGQHPAAI